MQEKFILQPTIEYEDELFANKKINYLLRNSKRLFQLIITNDSDETYIPTINVEYVLCDCNNGEDFTLGNTWKKYFDEMNNKPVVFINTSSMFNQFKEKSKDKESLKNVSGAGLWAQYMYYNYRDKMWNEQRTKFFFITTDEEYTNMLSYVNAGFTIELFPIYIRKEDVFKLVKKK